MGYNKNHLNPSPKQLVVQCDHCLTLSQCLLEQNVWGTTHGVWYWVGVLLTNVHACLVPNQTAIGMGACHPEFSSISMISSMGMCHDKLHPSKQFFFSLDTPIYRWWNAGKCMPHSTLVLHTTRAQALPHAPIHSLPLPCPIPTPPHLFPHEHHPLGTIDDSNAHDLLNFFVEGASSRDRTCSDPTEPGLV